MYRLQIDPTHARYTGIPVAHIRFNIGSGHEALNYSGLDAGKYGVTQKYAGNTTLEVGVNATDIPDVVFLGFREIMTAMIADAVEDGYLLAYFNGILLTGTEIKNKTGRDDRIVTGAPILADADPNIAPPADVDILHLEGFEGGWIYYHATSGGATGPLNAQIWYFDTTASLWINDGAAVVLGEHERLDLIQKYRNVFIRLSGVPAAVTIVDIHGFGESA